MGMAYIPLMLSFIPLIRDMKHGGYLIWYMLAAAWLTDTCAYFTGVALGKHKFSEISPKKSIEGCIGGAIGCMLFFGAYAYYLNTINIEMNWVLMGVLGLGISVIAQLGDFAASSIKRYCEVKDFGNIMPGHGGALDRFDSVIMIAPFIYLIFQFII
jgi:phosphatidate cytidylyltransferase